MSTNEAKTWVQWWKVTATDLVTYKVKETRDVALTSGKILAPIVFTRGFTTRRWIFVLFKTLYYLSISVPLIDESKRNDPALQMMAVEPEVLILCSGSRRPGRQ